MMEFISVDLLLNFSLGRAARTAARDQNTVS